MTEIGGFFATLKLKSDSQSFAKGKKDLDDVAKSSKNLKQEYSTGADSIIDKTMKMGQAFVGLAGAVAKMTAGLSAALVGVGVASAQSANQISTSAFKSGISSTSANIWGNAAKMASGDPGAMMAEMAGLNKTFQTVKYGDASGYTDLVTKLSFLGLTNETGMALAKTGQKGNVEGFMKEILTRAGGKMGSYSEAQDTFAALQNAGLNETANMVLQAWNLGKSPMDIYNESKSLNMRNEGGINTSNRANYEYNKIGVSISEVTGLIGDEINKNLLKHLTSITDWFKEHKGEIADFAKTIGITFGAIVDALSAFINSPVVKSLGMFAENTVKFAADTATKTSAGWSGMVNNSMAYDLLQKTGAEMPGFGQWWVNSNTESLKAGMESAKSSTTHKATIQLDIDTSDKVRLATFNVTYKKDAAGVEQFLVEQGATR